MQVSSLGNNNVCHFGPLEIWAERGLLHIVDNRDNGYKCVSVRDELLRMDSINEMIANSREYMKREGVMDAVEFERQRRMLFEMIEICRTAQIQGMPDDPSACRDLARRRPKTVCVTSGKAIM